MDTKQEVVKIEKLAFNQYSFKSSLYEKSNLSECELMTLLGAVFGASITNQKIIERSSIIIGITWRVPE